MTMSRLCLPATIAALAVLGGCYAPQPTTLYRSDDLPDTHWYELKEGDSRVKSLPAALQNSLVQQRQARVHRQCPGLYAVPGYKTPAHGAAPGNDPKVPGSDPDGLADSVAKKPGTVAHR